MKFFYTLFASLVLASTANAGRLSGTAAPTVGLQGFTTLTFWIETEAGESFRGVDASFTGALNQVHPAGMITPFVDLNPFIAEDVSADSQFLFRSSEVLAIEVEDTTSSLRGAIVGIWNIDPPVANPTPFAQLVIPAHELCPGPLYDGRCDQSIAYALAFDLGGVDPFLFSGNIWYSSVPEPSTALLAMLGLAGFAARRRR